MSFGRKSLPARVFKYRVYPESKWDEELLLKQLKLANDFWNKLVEYELNYRGEVESALRDASREYAESAAEDDRISRLFQSAKESFNSKLLNEKEYNEKVREFTALRKENNKRLWANRKVAWGLIGKWLEKRKKRYYEDRKELRAEWREKGLSPYTANAVMFSARWPMSRKPLFHRFNGDGSVVVQLINGCQWSGLFGKNRYVVLSREAEDGWLRMRFRVGTDRLTHEPVWVRFWLKLHRGNSGRRYLPRDDDVVKFVTVKRDVSGIEMNIAGIRRKHGAAVRVGVSFVVVRQEGWVERRDGKLAALKFCWRRCEDGGLRTAVIVDEDGGVQFVGLDPQWMLDRGMRLEDLLDKADSIRSYRDRLLNELKGKLREVADARLRERLKLVFFSRSLYRVAAFLLSLTTAEKEIFSSDVYELVTAWLKRDSHLCRYENGLRRRFFSIRDYCQKNLVADLRKRYGGIVVPDINFALVGRSKVNWNHVWQHQRSLAGGSFLKRQLISKFGDQCHLVKPDGLSALCSECGGKNEWSGEELMVTCSQCGASYDLDVNYCRNLLKHASVCVENRGG